MNEHYNMNEISYHMPMDQRIYRRPFGRPFGFGRPFFGAPFLGGFLGGLAAGALIRPYGYPFYPYPPYGFFW